MPVGNSDNTTVVIDSAAADNDVTVLILNETKGIGVFVNLSSLYLFLLPVPSTFCQIFCILLVFGGPGI